MSRRREQAARDAADRPAAQDAPAPEERRAEARTIEEDASPRPTPPGAASEDGQPTDLAAARDRLRRAAPAHMTLPDTSGGRVSPAVEEAARISRELQLSGGGKLDQPATPDGRTLLDLRRETLAGQLPEEVLEKGELRAALIAPASLPAPATEEAQPSGEAVEFSAPSSGDSGGAIPPRSRERLAEVAAGAELLAFGMAPASIEAVPSSARIGEPLITEETKAQAPNEGGGDEVNAAQQGAQGEGGGAPASDAANGSEGGSEGAQGAQEGAEGAEGGSASPAASEGAQEAQEGAGAQGGSPEEARAATGSEARSEGE